MGVVGMAEYIEKHKVVNLLTALENECQQFKPFEGFEHAMYRKLCETEIAIGKLPAADVVPAAQWIPITERLPEKWLDDAGMVNYMIYSPDFGVDIGCYHAEAKKWLCMALPCTVTHWMPLPEPPEMDGGADNG